MPPSKIRGCMVGVCHRRLAESRLRVSEVDFAGQTYANMALSVGKRFQPTLRRRLQKPRRGFEDSNFLNRKFLWLPFRDCPKDHFEFRRFQTEPIRDVG